MWWKTNNGTAPQLPPFPHTLKTSLLNNIPSTRPKKRARTTDSKSINITNNTNNTNNTNLSTLNDTTFINGSGGFPPRQHQRDVVQQVLTKINTSLNIVPNLLIQHSTGSGKSLSIAWLVTSLLDATTSTGGKFDLVLVLNDRTILDSQLGRVVERFLEANTQPPSFHRPRNGADLRNILINHISRSLDPNQMHAQRRVIVSTLQKFAAIELKEMNQHFVQRSQRGLRIAVVADEAHRSHGKTATSHMFELFGGTRRDGDDLRETQARGITLFGFTATPQRSALRLFGTRRSQDGTIPKHLQGE